MEGATGWASIRECRRPDGRQQPLAAGLPLRGPPTRSPSPLTRALALATARSTSATALTRSWDRCLRGATAHLAPVAAIVCIWAAILAIWMCAFDVKRVTGSWEAGLCREDAVW